MDKHRVFGAIKNLRVRLITECLPRACDEFERNAIKRIESTLESMAIQLKENKLPPRSERHANVTRMVEEMDPRVIPPDVGAELISIERFFRGAGGQ